MSKWLLVKNLEVLLVPLIPLMFLLARRFASALSLVFLPKIRKFQAIDKNTDLAFENRVGVKYKFGLEKWLR